MKLKCIIIDDEPLSIEILEGYLKRISNVEVVATFGDAISAIEKFDEISFDFLFLDIEMPRLSGMDFLKSLPHPPLAIIVSANKNYAIEGYELNVVDYLLKPITFERVVKSVNKIVEVKSKNTQSAQLPESSGYIFLKENKKMVRLKMDDILYIESVKDYVKVVANDRTVITKQNLNHFEQLLDGSKFIRIHRSFIVAAAHLDAFSPSAVEIGKIEIPIGRLYKDKALKRLVEIGKLM